MTVSTTISYVTPRPAGNGVTTVFNFPFKVLETTDIVSGLIDSLSVYYPQINGVNFTVTGVDQNGGGQVTYVVPPPAGYTVDIRSAPPETQPTALTNQGKYLANSVEDAFDRVVLELQSLERRAYTFGIHGPDTEITPWPSLPSPQSRLGQVVVFDPITGLPGAGQPTTSIVTAGTIVGLLGGTPLLQITQTAAEIAVGVTPLNLTKPEGNFLRYITSWVPGQADTANANSNALNNATKVCAYSKAILQLPAASYTSPLIITQTWNCSAASAATTTTNGGLWIRGMGKNCTFIQFQGASNNVGVAWDMVGLAYGRFEEFTFLNGSASAGINTNCARIAVLQGAVNNSGFLFSGINTWLNVGLLSYGDYIVWNAGAEQQHFIDCHAEAYSTAGTAQPFIFVCAGSAAGQTSAFQTIQTPVSSMTLIHWEGPSAALVFHGPRGIVFHYTAAGALGQIYFDDWCQSNYGGGEFVFMSDDSSSIGGVGCGIYDCGGSRLTMEVNTTNGDQRVCIFNAALAVNIKFEGYAAASVNITAAAFLFTSTSVPTNCSFDWVPNTAGGYTAGNLVSVQGTENGIYARGKIAGANLVAVSNARTISGYPAVGYSGSGTDFAGVTGVQLKQGATSNGNFCLTEITTAGNQVSGSSVITEGVQTTAAVSTVATILTVPNLTNIIYVTGAAAGGAKFFDMVKMMYGGASVKVIDSDGTGSPAARTYTIASSNQLQLAMASGTYAIQATCIGVGIQA